MNIKPLILFFILIVQFTLYYSCSSVSYTKALKLNNINTFNEYLQSHPKSKKKSIVLVKIDSLEYQNSRKINTLLSYNTYIQNQPNGKYIDISNEKIDSIDFEYALIQNTISSFEKYLKNHPNGKYKLTATNNIESKEYLSTCKSNNLDSYCKFFMKYPEGDNANNILSILKKIKSPKKFTKDIILAELGNQNALIKLASNNDCYSQIYSFSLINRDRNNLFIHKLLIENGFIPSINYLYKLSISGDGAVSIPSSEIIQNIFVNTKSSLLGKYYRNNILNTINRFGGLVAKDESELSISNWINLTYSSDVTRRELACRVLGTFPFKDTIIYSLERVVMSNDSYIQVKIAAIEALGNIDNVESSELLIKCYNQLKNKNSLLLNNALFSSFSVNGTMTSFNFLMKLYDSINDKNTKNEIGRAICLFKGDFSNQFKLKTFKGNDIGIISGFTKEEFIELVENTKNAPDSISIPIFKEFLKFVFNCDYNSYSIYSHKKDLLSIIYNALYARSNELTMEYHQMVLEKGNLYLIQKSFLNNSFLRYLIFDGLKLFVYEHDWNEKEKEKFSEYKKYWYDYSSVKNTLGGMLQTYCYWNSENDNKLFTDIENLLNICSDKELNIYILNSLNIIKPTHKTISNLIALLPSDKICLSWRLLREYNELSNWIAPNNKIKAFQLLSENNIDSLNTFSSLIDSVLLSSFRENENALYCINKIFGFKRINTINKLSKILLNEIIVNSVTHYSYVSALLTAGNNDDIKKACLFLREKGNLNLAQSFLNTNDSELVSEAKNWAKKNGVTINTEIVPIQPYIVKRGSWK